jgi:hypothetical protein
MVIIGIDAVGKARRTGEAILERTRSIFRSLGMPDYTATRIEAIGGETMYGPHARTRHAREVMMRVAVNHPLKEALEIFAREIAPSATSWAPGTTTPGGGRPPVSALVRQFAFTLPKRSVPIRVVIDGESRSITVPLEGGWSPTPPDAPPTPAIDDVPGTTVRVPLVKLAFARSGDKGDISNVGVIARRPEYLPVILDQVTPAAVKLYFAHLVKGEVRRYLVPGIHACNFMLFEALDGGGPGSLRMDPLGKGMAQMLLDMPVAVPESMASELASSPCGVAH